MLPSSMHTLWAGSDSYNLSELNTVQGSTVNRYLSSSLPFCVRFNVAVTRHAATLDTEPLAKSYSGGSRTHLFSNHFQYARASLGSVKLVSAVVVLPYRTSISPFRAWSRGLEAQEFVRRCKTIVRPPRHQTILCTVERSI